MKPRVAQRVRAALMRPAPHDADLTTHWIRPHDGRWFAELVRP